MARTRKNRTRNHKPRTSREYHWVVPALIVGLFLFVLAGLGSGHVNSIPVVYGLFLLSVFGAWFALRTRVIYLRGYAISRDNEPAKFWLILLLSIVPPLVISGGLVVLHVVSLFAA